MMGLIMPPSASCPPLDLCCLSDNFGSTLLQCDAAGSLSISQLQDMPLWLRNSLNFRNACDDAQRGSRVGHEASLLHSTDRGIIHLTHHECVGLFIHRLLHLVPLSPPAVCIFVRGTLTETKPLSCVPCAHQ